jgi:hypothetical protein
MKPAMIVKRQPIDHFIHRCPARLKLHAVQTSDLQRSPQAFRRRIDAPMSRNTRGICQIGQNQWIKLSDDIAF